MHSNNSAFLLSLTMNLRVQILMTSKSSWCGLTVLLPSRFQKVHYCRKCLAYMTYIPEFGSKKNCTNSPLYLQRKRQNQLNIIDKLFLLWNNRCSQVIISIVLWTEFPRIKATPVLRILQSWRDYWLIRTSAIVECSDVVGLKHNYLRLSLVSLAGIHCSPLCVTCHPCN